MDISDQIVSIDSQMNLYVNLLEKNFDTHMNIIWASVGLLLAAIGWLITSTEARNFLSFSPINIASRIVIILAAIIHYVLLWVTYNNSKQLYNSASKYFHFIDEELFFYKLPFGICIFRAAISFVLFAYLYFLVKGMQK